MRLRHFRAIVLMAIVVVLAGVTACGGSPKTTATRPEPDGAAPVATADRTGVAVPELLAFTGRTLDGQPFDGRSLAGKPAVLWFWAPWCATCASEADGVAAAARTYAGRVTVLGIAGMGETADMREFVKDFEVAGLPHLNDASGVLWRRFGITQQSLFVLVDRTGKVTGKGFLDNEQFPDKVAALAAG